MEFSKAKIGGIVAATTIAAYGMYRQYSGDKSDSE
jgi:hypothetical protein